MHFGSRMKKKSEKGSWHGSPWNCSAVLRKLHQGCWGVLEPMSPARGNHLPPHLPGVVLPWHPLPRSVTGTNTARDFRATRRGPRSFFTSEAEVWEAQSHVHQEHNVLCPDSMPLTVWSTLQARWIFTWLVQNQQGLNKWQRTDANPHLTHQPIRLNPALYLPLDYSTSLYAILPWLHF